MANDNAQVLKDGFEKAYQKIVEHLTKQYFELAERLLLEVPRHREFLGFTGNTQTSYSCGVYVDGTLQGVVIQRNWNAPPVHVKVRMGEWVYLREPYEGRARSVRGKVRTFKEFGLATSLDFLKSYNAKKGHIQIVMTTGTEYSEYLEVIRNLDVLTGTYQAASAILKNGFKPIESSKK